MKYLLAILFISTLVSCKTKPEKEEAKSPYFEGFVEFNIVFNGKTPEMTNSLKKHFGQREITYIGKNGYFGREFIDSNNIILTKEIFRPDSLRMYLYSINSDTVYYTDAMEQNNSRIVSVTKNSAVNILNHTVDIIKLRSEFKGGPNLNHNPFYIYTTYYNDVNYLINPLAYKNMRLDNVEDVFSASPHITTGVTLQYGEVATFTSTAVRIITTPLPNWHFDIPKNKVFAKQPN